ncbi:MAG: tyrosine-type recombinase/integrase [Lachnospiraceae bacterium]|nr:tyrosine-type recombinase/integrase [Lachnospiraceae bacterium]
MILKEEVSKYLHYCKFQKELDDKTIKAYRVDLEQFVLFIEERGSDTTKENLNLYLFHIHSKYKQKTVKRKIASVKALFHYLEEEELIELNPFHKVKTKFKEEIVLPKIVPRDIIEQLLDYLYKKRLSEEYSEWQRKLILRDIAVIEMLFATGLRISELCHLQSKLFDSKNGVLCIRGKGGKERYLQIGNEDVLIILNVYKQHFEDDIKRHGFFFVNRYGQQMSEQSARRMIHKYAIEIQAEINITPHMFRHSFATFLMEEDVNIRYIQKMLGHASINTTQIYTYVATEKEREILRTRHPRNRMRSYCTDPSLH